MAEVVIKPCGCTNEFQDQRYGPGRRVHNVSAKGDKATCTVCGTTKSN